LIEGAPQIIATAITKAVGQLIIGTSINVTDFCKVPMSLNLAIAFSRRRNG